MREKLKYDRYLELKKFYQDKVSMIATFRMIFFVIMIISFIGQYYYYPVFFRSIFIISLIVFVILVIIHDKYYKFYDYYCKYVKILDSYVARENGEWKKFSDDGSDFLEDSDSFFSDLDVLGKNSLFQYLNVCQTLGGREYLKNRLSNLEMDNNTLKREQDGIKEIVDNISFAIDFQVALSEYEKKKIHLEKEFANFDIKMGIKWFDLGLAIVVSSLCLLFLLLGYLGIISYRYFYGMFLFNFVSSFLYSYIFRDEYRRIDRLIKNYKGLGSIFDVVLRQSFTSDKLLLIQENIKYGMSTVNDMLKLDALNSLKNNFLSNFCLNGLFGINFILLYQISRFINLEFLGLKQAICDVEEVEAMVSLAGIGIVKRESCMPHSDSKVRLSFSGIKHPLLDESYCVANDFFSKSGVNIITGSNMGGKTTFIRTIGLNLLLMNAGTYVCAKEFSSCYLKLFTSMRVKDDTAKGISTFYGELLRIKEMVEYVNKGNMLVLIDEIFKGTNYQDRIYGAKNVIERLKNAKTISFITTHDFELCDAIDVVNYHVKEEYEGDKIVFDYKIRKGKSVSTNARYLMKKLGIILK